MTSSRQNLPAIYTLDQIEQAIALPAFSKDLIQGIQDGFVALANGEFFACPIQTMGTPPFPFVETEGYAAQTCVKSGYFTKGDYYVIKVASGGYPMPTNSGLMQVYSQKTGKLEALLLDDGVLTEIRTAAVGALAAKLLAPKTIETIGVVGTSVQARYQLRMLPTVTDCRRVLVWGRTSSKVQALCEELSKEGWDIQSVDEIDQLLKECDLIVTTTCSREPLLGNNLDLLASRERKGLHITCIGSDSPGKIELVPQLVAKADLLVADTVEQTLERGEFQRSVQDGLVTKDSIVSLGMLVEQTNLHRTKTDDNRLTIFDSSGVALQDCVVSDMTYKTLRENFKDK
jgi:ornithine cyclodeaminase